MAHEKNALRDDQRKTMILIWIANSTEFFITCLPGHNQHDIDAGIEYAVDLYLNKGETPGSAIPRGVAAARRRIKQRQTAAAASAIVIHLAQRRRGMGA